jgi:hypothetical protein
MASGLRVNNFDLYRTAAGIAAGCAENFARAEAHFETAIEQSVVYRPAEPLAREFQGQSRAYWPIPNTVVVFSQEARFWHFVKNRIINGLYVAPGLQERQQ